jgi:hypothetical protein
MEELAHSVNIILTKGKVPYVVSYDNSKSEGQKISLAELPDNDIKAFYDFYSKWEEKSGGLFIPQGSILCFVMIIESLFSDKYKIEYEWIGGADPYAAWKEEQENAPKDVVY